MNRAFLAAAILLAAASAAIAQPAPQTPPQQQIEQLIGSLIIANTQAQAQIADLKKQLEDARKSGPQPPETPAK